MSELKPRITENGIDYILVGDYYIPGLKLPEEHRPIGKYGRMHREYLREVHPARLNTLILTGELWTYLADLNEQAQERLDTIMEQMKAADGVTDLYGVMYKPYDFDSTKVYPIIDYVYPGPQVEAVYYPFTRMSPRTDRLAQAGFIGMMPLSALVSIKIIMQVFRELLNV